MSLPTEAELGRAGVRLAVDGPVATVTLDRPDKRNSQTPTMWATLAAIGAGLPEDVRVVVLKGAGPSFSAGIDLGMFGPDGLPGERAFNEVLAGSDEEVADGIEVYQQGFVWLHDPRFVTIAQVHGHAIGAGFQLALACDLRVVSDDVGFCMKEPALGLVPDLAGTKPLVAVVGYARALEMCATARVVGAAEAHAVGLANAVVPVAELDDTVADLVAALLAHQPGAVRATKALLQSAAATDLETQRRLEREAQVRRFREIMPQPAR
jgi:enoyl-CoA hydratase/carnithine racemase